VISRKFILALLILALFLPASSCVKTSGDGKSEKVVVFKHGKIAGDPQLFRQLLDRFEAEHPGIQVIDETLPASTDEQHQFYVINLEGKSSDFDVLSMDVIWVPEFARAGWLRELSHIFPAEDREKFFPGPVRAVTWSEGIYAIPWYIDAGLLYYRKDLLEMHGLLPPKTWQELVTTAKTIASRGTDVYGYIWQGKQYEGLVCNVLEYFWGNEGDVIREGRSVINNPSNIHALTFMCDLIHRHGVTPPLVTTVIEEPTRHIFGSGRALFMRNWPYAWNVVQREGSAVKGNVGVCPLPAFPGHESASTLGGWQLGINRFSRNPSGAEKLVRFLTSPEAQKALALSIGYKPTRKSLYRDRDLQREQPFITGLYEIFMKARPRPVTPYYMMITQVMQAEFSAALSGIKTPESALNSAHKQVEYILQAEK